MCTEYNFIISYVRENLLHVFKFSACIPSSVTELLQYNRGLHGFPENKKRHMCILWTCWVCALGFLGSRSFRLQNLFSVCGDCKTIHLLFWLNKRLAMFDFSKMHSNENINTCLHLFLYAFCTTLYCHFNSEFVTCEMNSCDNNWWFIIKSLNVCSKTYLKIILSQFTLKCTTRPRQSLDRWQMVFGNSLG